MSDSHAPDRCDPAPDRDREQRIEAIKRWIDYIQSEPPEKWGPQQNAIVDDQLEAAQSVHPSASHRQHVSDVASEIIEVSDTSEDDSE